MYFYVWTFRCNKYMSLYVVWAHCLNKFTFYERCENVCSFLRCLTTLWQRPLESTKSCPAHVKSQRLFYVQAERSKNVVRTFFLRCLTTLWQRPLESTKSRPAHIKVTTFYQRKLHVLKTLWGRFCYSWVVIVENLWSCTDHRQNG
jgi:hypothetical protein